MKTLQHYCNQCGSHLGAVQFHTQGLAFCDESCSDMYFNRVPVSEEQITLPVNVPVNVVQLANGKGGLAA